MNFRTQISLDKPTKNKIGYASKTLLLGSCFVENIGEKLRYYRFQSEANPFGIIFNPVSLDRLVKRCAEKKLFTESDLFQHNDLWHSFEVHSQLSHPSKAILLQQLNDNVEATRFQIKNLTHCLITLGTAWVYRLKKTEEIVANCHKVPQSQFAKELLSVDKIEVALKSTVATIQKINPGVQFIFTISPVRHLKDGFVENTRSKAHLITALHKLLSTNTVNCQLSYFPSFEILLDELRDYRFYAEDMLHPNAVAIDYIWEKFSESWIAEEAFTKMETVEKIQKALRHRPFNPESEAHRKFLGKVEKWKKEVDWVD